jgi:hypothetical protein
MLAVRDSGPTVKALGDRQALSQIRFICKFHSSFVSHEHQGTSVAGLCSRRAEVCSLCRLVAAQSSLQKSSLRVIGGGLSCALVLVLSPSA